MPRNYDEMAQAEDRSFIIRGEKFTITRGSPELVGRVEALQKEFAESKADDYETVVKFLEDRLLMLIDDQNGAAARWQKLRETESLSYGEIMDVSVWAVEVITGLPTMPPAPSQGGRGKTAGSSKDG